MFRSCRGVIQRSPLRSPIDRQKFLELVDWLIQHMTAQRTTSSARQANERTDRQSHPTVWAEPIAEVTPEERDFARRTLHGDF